MNEEFFVEIGLSAGCRASVPERSDEEVMCPW